MDGVELSARDETPVTDDYEFERHGISGTHGGLGIETDSVGLAAGLEELPTDYQDEAPPARRHSHSEAVASPKRYEQEAIPPGTYMDGSSRPYAASEPGFPEYVEPPESVCDSGADPAPSVASSRYTVHSQTHEPLLAHAANGGAARRVSHRDPLAARPMRRVRTHAAFDPTPPSRSASQRRTGNAPPPSRALTKVASKSNLRDVSGRVTGRDAVREPPRVSKPQKAARPIPKGPPDGLAPATQAAGGAIGKRPPTRLNLVPARKLNPKDLKDPVRRWYKIDQHGRMNIIQADKYELMQQHGVHTRDLRILDPSLTSSYPSCILCREHALVVNLEFVQVIITTDTTLVLNAENDLIQPFVTELQRRLSANNAVDCTDPERLMDTQTQASRDVTKELSYELKVLEVCLDHIASYMASLVSDLEKSAYPALDALTVRVNALNLERVRRVKNRMVRLNTRVETIRQVLEKYLDDDEDMEDLNLTGQRIVAQREAERARMRDVKRAEDLSRYEAKRDMKLNEDCNASISSFSSSSASSEEEDRSWLSEEVEMLIEPYFMSFDNTWNRLQTLAEYIDDTEDLINITLDSHRNQLIQIDLLLTAATFCVGLVTLVAGIFGMNLANGQEGSKATFDAVSIATCLLAIFLLIGFVLLMRWKRLAFD